jgi:predicted metalloprotease with PDZ domain
MCVAATAFFLTSDAAIAGEGPTLRLELDARDLPRKLMHTRIVLPCRPGKLALWYPKWIPGTHAPEGPIQDVAGLRIVTPDGTPLPWRRDETDVYRVECNVPAGAESVVVRLDTICARAAEAAAGYLTFGNESVGIINWATCLMYPEGPSADEIRVDATLILPPSWEIASALEAKQTITGTDAMVAGQVVMKGGFKSVQFGRVSLTRLADSPLIAGEHLRKIPLDTGPFPPASLDLVSESPAALQVPPDVVAIYSRVAQQAGAMFGICHYPSFHFLVTCSDDIGYLGLEHLESSINGVRQRDLLDRRQLRGWMGNLLPHEYVHSWCGKFRRPAGMCTPDFHTPQKTRLLWVYEGLAEYLGEVLMVRSGMIDAPEYRRMLTANISSLVHREGRRWRSLEDTGVASQLLRDGGPAWHELRRGQDYYFEGALIWLEADAIIREKSGGKRSLEDFCRKFLGREPTVAPVVPYDLAEVVSTLDGVCPYEWERFLRDRAEKPLDALPLDVVGRLGYRVSYTSQDRSGSSGISRRGGGGASARDSLGLDFDGEGRIVDVVPGMVGDKSGLAPGMKVIGVNGQVYSADRLHDALAESPRRKKIEFLLIEGDRFRTVALDYSGGPRYLELVRDPSRPDRLAEILRPVAIASSPTPQAATTAIPAPKGYVCYRASRPIRIDGRLDDEEWKSAPWTDAFVDIEGDVRPRPRFQTRARMLWDDTYFYVGAVLEEPHAWGTLTKHDSVIFHDNDFEIFIDPDGDNHEYYEIEINALNTEWDLFLKKPYRDGGPARNEWEISGLKTAVHVEGTLNDPRDKDASWSVEFAIPWTVLAEFAHRPAPPRDGDQWRVNFSRVEWRHEVVDGRYRKVPKTPEDNWVWSPQGAIDMHRPERWGYVQFSTAPPGQASYKADPIGPIRDRLMQIYHAQVDYRKRTQRWAASLDELKLPAAAGVPPHGAELHSTPDGYVATITITPPGSKPENWTIRQDSRIRRDPLSDDPSIQSPRRR